MSQNLSFQWGKPKFNLLDQPSETHLYDFHRLSSKISPLPWTNIIFVHSKELPCINEHYRALKAITVLP